GKVAVIELWASWCKSCRVNAKSFRPLYEKYKNSGFEIVGIAREYKDTNKWLNALEADQYPWPNLVAMEEYHHIWAQYGIPHMAGRTILVSRDGIVIKIDPTAADVEKYLMDKK
ncbi:MAG: TlpA family protein disulfide reductase, partial [Alistipes sp.]|nr:TlpA family protein disulfide reductase [Alistipes sp.]